ncbi:ATP-binding cassette, subfamily B [Eubacterium maltosivorans]|uniref:ABC transporter ATP-binding protein n=1 Tax=Eubacterium maltosivorans TaxID=2041044 RepID=UPI00087ED148|nr:ABC transporter ATP-binding protein [Eubacterium maltosivorans]WPK79718.1 putative ABC transporter ATP-binding protein [Eubacterium maltosivorans]SDP04129.1 ATP-binding cassette, subfamily B [Eubacterium maltosivorans]
MIELAHYLKHFKKEMILGPFFKLTEAVFELIVPLVMASIIDVGIKNGDTRYVYHMGGLMAALGAVGLCFALTAQYFAARASQGTGTLIRRDFFAHINRLSYAELDKIGTPSLITRITNDIDQLQVAVAMTIRLLLRVPFLIIGATIMAMTIDLKLSVIFLVAAPLIALTIYFVMSRAVPVYKKIQARLDGISLITRENLDGVRVIRAFSRQKSETARFAAANKNLMKASLKAGHISSLLNPLTYAIVNIAILFILWFGGIRVNAGDLSQGEVIAFVNYMTQILLALIVAANLVVIFTKAAASAARINAVFDTEPSVIPGAALPGPVFANTGDEIRFQDVSFSYNQNNEYALKNLSFSIKKGETIGVIGGTGAGKSTLVNLIPRFYDVTTGRVDVAGVGVREYPLGQLRFKIGIVPQKAVLFTGTVRENMKWGNPQANDEEIEQALEIAQAAEIIQKMPKGLDTEIYQGGKNLSGGQKQRLTIARALVRHPEILILDDSASALDFATDAALRKAIRQKTGEMTVLMVSQRVTTVKNADRIIVLDQGKMAGFGTHEALFKDCGVYREICLSQLSSQEVNK